MNTAAAERLSYRRAGAGHPLILVHGYLGGSGVWRSQIAYFSADHDVIAPDLAGFGESAHLAAPDRIEDHASQVLALLDDLGVGRFDLLGHSMGGMIVQHMAAVAGARISKLILYGTGPVGVMPDRFETIEDSRRRLRADGLAVTAQRIAATWFLHGKAAEGYALCETIATRATLQAALASLDAWEHWDGRAALAEIVSPTLVLWGDHDRSYGWTQPEALWRGVPDSCLAVVPGCAHNVHMEKPGLFNSLVADFLAGG
jgi:pimeloyl-ACP methyl ester carboxylesterase